MCYTANQPCVCDNIGLINIINNVCYCTNQITVIELALRWVNNVIK